jgi:DNA repair protein RadC
VTKNLLEAANLLQVRLVDHVILGSPEGGRTPFYSFREAGLI